MMVSDIRHDISKLRKEAGGQVHSVSANHIRFTAGGRMLTSSPGPNQVSSYDY